MGSGGSKTSADTPQLEKEMQAKKARSLLSLKILLLGSGESGKSTFLRQMLKRERPFTPLELSNFGSSLRANAVQSMQVLLEQAEKFLYKFDDEAVTHVERVKSFPLGSGTVPFSVELATSIDLLWKHDTVKKVYGRRNEFWLLEAAPYFFENIVRFAQEEFVPNDTDCINARVLSTGLSSVDLELSPLSVSLVDVGGQRNERRKWLHAFSDVNAVVFVVNLADYNNVLYEDPEVNRMVEALSLFEETINNETYFADTPFYLLFNKKDLFVKMVKIVPLNFCEPFEQYKGTEDFDECIEFITEVFKSKVKGKQNRLSIFSLNSTQVSEIEVTWGAIFDNIKEIRKKEIKEGERLAAL
eukprot:Lithocolla_globosa_v1_NODE_5173_length_1288_cov_37.358475.p1 type:complete len:357 gc:universal NODE_5173_length_1288_cov_37.358475:1243-173(-)